MEARACALPVGLGDGGDDGHRRRDADVDASFGDILDNLEMGFMGMYRGTRDRFSMTSIRSSWLSGTERSRNGLAKADIDVDQFVLGAAAGYALTEKFVVLGGLRYYDLSAEVKVTGPLGNTADAETDESWVDPYLGARYTIRSRRRGP